MAVYETLLIAYPLLLLYPVWRDTISAGSFNFVEALLITPVAILLPVLLLTWYLRGNREAGWLGCPACCPMRWSPSTIWGWSSHFSDGNTSVS